MATLRKDGRWVATWTHPATKKRESFYGATNLEADGLRDAAARAHESGRTLSADPTLHEIATEIWWPTVEGTVEPTSLRRYRDVYVRYVRPEFGARLAGSVTRSEVQRWVNAIMATPVEGRARKPAGQLLSPETARKAKGLLGTIYRLAVAERVVAHNPCDGVKIRTTPQRHRSLSMEDVRRVLGMVGGTPLDGPVFAALILGLRRGEVCGLRWEHLDESKRRVSIQASRVATPTLIPGRKGAIRDKGTKTKGSNRSFVLPPPLWDALVSRANRDSVYLFPNSRGGGANPEHVTAKWKAVAAVLGLPDWTFHDLRHGAAGTLAALGVDLLTIAAVLGHTKIDTTQLYAAAQEATATRAFAGLSAELFRVDERLPDVVG